MLKLLILLIAGTLTGPTVRVDMLEGAPREGSLVECQQDSLIVESEEGTQQLDRSRVLSLQMVRADELPPLSDPAPLVVRLTDGSHFETIDIESSERDATLSLPPALFNTASPGKVDVSAIRSVRRPFAMDASAGTAGRLEQQWREILALQPGGDLIVIRKSGGDTLNYVEGVIGDVGPDKITFTLDEQPIEVAREKVFGWIYYRGPQDTEQPRAPIVVEGHGYRLMALDVVWSAEQWQVEMPHLGRLSLAREFLHAIDFSAGKVLFLSDLDPRSADWSPPASLSLVSSLLKGYVRDRGFFTPRLSLEYPPESLAPSEATSAGISQQVEFRKGLAIRGKSQLVYRLPEGFRQFRAAAGIDPQARATGAVEFRLVGDGKELFHERIDGSDAPRDIVCSIEGIRQLELVVDFGSQNPLEMGSGATLHLGHARLTK